MASPRNSLHCYIVTSAEIRRSTIDDSRFTILDARPAFLLQSPPNPAQRIIKIVHHTLFQGNDSVVRNMNAFGANLRATLRDITITDPVSIPQFLHPILGVQRMHLERGDVD